ARARRRGRDLRRGGRRPDELPLRRRDALRDGRRPPGGQRRGVVQRVAVARPARRSRSTAEARLDRRGARVSAREAVPGLRLDGQAALVTGGASGIGLETALTLADLGADVAVLDRDAEGAAAAVERIEAVGRRAVAAVGDVGSEADVAGAFETARTGLGDVG